jgi:hypothetical protein
MTASTRVGAIIGFAIVMVGGGTGPASGQWLCGIITDCIDPYETPHKITTSYGDEVTNVHSACRICMEDGGEVSPSSCHPSCQPTLGDQSAYLRLLAAAQDGPTVDVVRLALELPAYASFNSSRQTLQIFDCLAVNVVANLPLTKELFAVAESAANSGGRFKTHDANRTADVGLN